MQEVYRDGTAGPFKELPKDNAAAMQAITDSIMKPKVDHVRIVAGGPAQESVEPLPAGQPAPRAANVQIENAFTYHPPVGNQADRYNRLRSSAKALAYLIDDLCPPSRERSLAMTKLEESVMWANASIARNTLTATSPIDH